MRIGPLGIWEILIILVVILLLFGPRRLPEMAKGIGQSVREFRKGIRDLKDDIGKEDEPAKANNVTVSSTPAQSSRVEPSQSSVAPVASSAAEPVPERQVQVTERPLQVEHQVEQPAPPTGQTAERTEVKSA